MEGNRSRHRRPPRRMRVAGAAHLSLARTLVTPYREDDPP